MSFILSPGLLAGLVLPQAGPTRLLPCVLTSLSSPIRGLISSLTPVLGAVTEERASDTGQEPGEGGTFTGGRAAVVFQVGAVLAFVVLSTLAEIVAGTVVALGTVLAGVGLAIIYVQLQGAGAGQRERTQEGKGVIIPSRGQRTLEPDPFTCFY